MARLGARARAVFAPPLFAGGDLVIYGFGRDEVMPPCIVDRPVGTGFWLLMLLQSRTTFARGAGSAPRDCPAGTLVIWRPGEAQWFGALVRRWRHSWLHCDGAFLRSIVSAARLPTATPIAGLPRGAFERALADIDAEVRGHARPDRVIVGNALHSLVRVAARVLEDEARPVPERWLAVRRAIENRHHEEWSLDALAALAGCTPTHLCDEFRRHFGVPPYRFLLNVRLEQAGLLLLDRTVTVAEVSRAVGFPDVRHFTRIFAEHHGLTPARMRGRPPG